MFERSLQDVVKGLRAQPTSEGRTEFASLVLQECRKEMASNDAVIKANAVLKVSHLRMLGYDDRNFGDDSTSFHVIETMSLQPFKQKRIGYLAASTILTPDSPLLLLATNSLKKELQSPQMYASGIALGSISNFASRDLARDLLPDVISTSSLSTKPYIRKRGTLCVYRLCTRYPEGLRDGGYDALRSRLDDSDNSVVSCAVNAVCELAKANPRNVLPLTPQLYQLLTSSGNNWLTIKVVKLYSSLLNVEPRLAKKLLDPLAHIIKTTAAKSLLYECISTVTKALGHVVSRDPETDKKLQSIVQICAVKLKEFIRDSDQNLKYLGLVGFVELTKAYPYVAQEHKDLVLLCLNDEDATVRLRALELLAGMSNKNTVSGIVTRLLEHLAAAPPGKFRDAIVETCVNACADEDFERVPSCEWYFAVLMDLARLGKGAHGSLLAKQIVSVAMRVESIREFASDACTRLLLHVEDENESKDVVADEILSACAFVACEYYIVPGDFSSQFDDVSSYANPAFTDSDENIKRKEDMVKLIEGLLAEDNQDAAHTIISRSKLSTETRCVFILNAFKLAVRGGKEHLALKHNEKWLFSSSFRIRERAQWCQLWCKGGNKAFITEDVPLGPVHAKAQKHVPVPPELDLSIRKGLQTPTTSSSKSVPVSFRGHTRKYETASDQNRVISATSNDAKSLGSILQPPTSVNRSLFILGASPQVPTDSSRSKRKQKDIIDSSDDEQEQEVIAPVQSKAKLWSSTLYSSQRHDAKSSRIVMAPTSLPIGFTENDDKEEYSKSTQKGVLTLADIDVLNDDASVPASPVSREVSSPVIEKTEKKKKSKDETKKKKKKKKKSETTESLITTTTATTSSIIEEGDLLDFSEL